MRMSHNSKLCEQIKQNTIADGNPILIFYDFKLKN